MPVYEYWCNDCRRKVTLYIKSLSQLTKAVCTACGGQNLTRLFSSFALHKTDKAIYEDILSDSRLTRGMMENDPRALAEWSRKMGETTGEMSPEYEDMMQRMEKGESWEKIVTEMQERELSSEERPAEE